MFGVECAHDFEDESIHGSDGDARAEEEHG
jgi:hypothetical protein